jgi:hypothetical protein
MYFLITAKELQTLFPYDEYGNGAQSGGSEEHRERTEIANRIRSRPVPAPTSLKCTRSLAEMPTLHDRERYMQGWREGREEAAARAREDVLKELEYYIKQPCFTQGQSESKLRWIGEKIQSLRHEARQEQAP